MKSLDRMTDSVEREAEQTLKDSEDRGAWRAPAVCWITEFRHDLVTKTAFLFLLRILITTILSS